VSTSYDDANESFPINITKPVEIVGESRQSVQLNPSSNYAIVVNGDANYVGDDFGYSSIRDLSIIGGNGGIQFKNAANCEVIRVTTKGVSGVGISYANDSHSQQSQYLEDVRVLDCGSDGIVMASGAKTHASVIVGRRCSGNGGSGVVARYRAVNIFGGNFEGNDGYSVEVDQGTVNIRGAYFEGNATGSNIAEINISGGDGGIIDGCWSQGLGATTGRLTLTEGTRLQCRTALHRPIPAG
jgi:hypothetical protein